MEDRVALHSWRNFEITQQPLWPDEKKLNFVLEELKKLPSLVFSGETRNLRKLLCEVERGNAFIVQAGNCAESFNDCHGPEIHNFLRIINFMGSILEGAFQIPVVKIGRVAGQYGKPRSSDFEIIDGVKLPVFRGENVNSLKEDLSDRTPNPDRLIEGYFRSAATLNLLRAFTQGNYGSDNYRSDWFHFPYSEKIVTSELFNRYIKGMSELLLKDSNTMSEVFISHEALILEYETAFTRLDTTEGGIYNTSAHFLWIGDRTRSLNSAHVEYISQIENPIGIKVGPGSRSDEIVEVIKKVNPKNEAGKVVLIIRYGMENLRARLGELILKIKESGLNAIWMIDPMHGNTKTISGRKVRYFNDILCETVAFFEVCSLHNVFPGGIHLEMTSSLVTECIGGNHGVDYSELEYNYQSLVDPRLNGSQVIELLFEIHKKFQKC
jgi:3-deoxy-7-phosphoheptulonate synthase